MREALLWTILLLGVAVDAASAEALRTLPHVPDAEFRIAEVFDNRIELFIELYATKDPDVVDYATGRKVLRVILSPTGDTSYELAPHPFLIWWGRALWKDPEEDGINGNEEIQEDNIVFHANPYLRLYRDQRIGHRSLVFVLELPGQGDFDLIQRRGASISDMRFPVGACA